MADVYGTYQIIDDAKDKIVAAMTSLKTAMASGYDPTFSYIYSHHKPAQLELNAVSVEFETIERRDSGGGAPGVVFAYYMSFSIRVHTGYEGGFIDNVTISQLLNSIDNYLSTHIDLGGGHRIADISDYAANQSWEDSGTVGGSLTVTIEKAIDHVQA